MKKSTYRKPKMRIPMPPEMKVFKNKRQNRLNEIKQKEELDDIPIQMDLPFDKWRP